MNYALEILETALQKELIAKASAEELTQGKGFTMSASTKRAFAKSLELANERIPQLEKAISILAFPYLV